jgi:hypothetical protein
MTTRRPHWTARCVQQVRGSAVIGSPCPSGHSELVTGPNIRLALQSRRATYGLWSSQSPRSGPIRSLDSLGSRSRALLHLCPRPRRLPSLGQRLQRGHLPQPRRASRPLAAHRRSPHRRRPPLPRAQASGIEALQQIAKMPAAHRSGLLADDDVDLERADGGNESQEHDDEAASLRVPGPGVLQVEDPGDPWEEVRVGGVSRQLVPAPRLAEGSPLAHAPSG